MLKFYLNLSYTEKANRATKIHKGVDNQEMVKESLVIKTLVRCGLSSGEGLAHVC